MGTRDRSSGHVIQGTSHSSASSREHRTACYSMTDHYSATANSALIRYFGRIDRNYAARTECFGVEPPWRMMVARGIKETRPVWMTH